MDSNARIAIIQQNMKNLKKTYQSLRTKLASTERQIKKIRRKEREKSEVETKTTTIEATA
jgi:prefoldin subunit 5